jgi:hypothetical protein
MNIQSAGRLGNQLFIFGHALNLQINTRVRSVDIFADRFHSEINQELLNTFNFLSNYGIILKVNNCYGFLLKAIDKLNRYSPRLSKLIRRTLRIETEGMDTLSENAWIQRGFFQEDLLPENVLIKMDFILREILVNHVSHESLSQRMPFLDKGYQAIHMRRTDFFSTEAGVIDPSSQLECLQSDLKVVICTDATKEEILTKLNYENFEIITPIESTAWETLAILSRADNLVMTNSTLSFWAGFIASKEGKTVWTPSVWNKKSQELRKLPYNCSNTYIPRFEES